MMKLLTLKDFLAGAVAEAIAAGLSGKTRNWSPIGPVTLNPDRESIVRALPECNDIQHSKSRMIQVTQG